MSKEKLHFSVDLWGEYSLISKKKAREIHLKTANNMGRKET